METSFMILKSMQYQNNPLPRPHAFDGLMYREYNGEALASQSYSPAMNVSFLDNIFQFVKIKQTVDPD